MAAHETPVDDTHEEHAGSHEFPPEPAVRHVTPAPEDFDNPPGFANYVWPIFWVGVIGVLVAVVCAGGWGGFAK